MPGAYWELVGYFEPSPFFFLFFCFLSSPPPPQNPLRSYWMSFSAMPFHLHFLFPSRTKFSSPAGGKTRGKVSHLRMCSWEEENLPVAPSWEPAYRMKIRPNVRASVSGPPQTVVGRKGWRRWPDFRVSSILCFTMKTRVVRPYEYVGHLARFIALHMAVHTWFLLGSFCFLSCCVCWVDAPFPTF